MSDHTPIIISVKEVCRLTSLSRAFISKIRAKGQFPVPVQLGEKRIGFVRAEIETWLGERIGARPSNDNTLEQEKAA